MDTASTPCAGTPRAEGTIRAHASEATREPRADPTPAPFVWTRQDLKLENAVLFVATLLAVFLPIPPIGGIIALGLAFWSGLSRQWMQMVAALACAAYSLLPSLGIFALVVSTVS